MSWFNRIRSATSRLASNALSRAWRLASNIIPESVQRRITDFGNWLTDRVGPDQTPQVLKKIVEHVRANYPPRQSFEVRESNSALRNFARVYTINGIEGFDARNFLDDARENMTRVLRENWETKVKLIFKCYMERPSTLGETVIKPANFHSDNHIYLEGTDEDDIYIILTERILEKMATFQSGGSGWRLYCIIKLELHTTRYNPLRGETWIPLPKELANKKYQKHEPISFSYYIKCFDDNVFKPRLRSYTGEDAMQKFVEWLENDVKEIANIPEKKMIFKIQEQQQYEKETKCWICKGELNNDKVRDHYHFTGRYRGAAHNSCNLKYRKPNFTPVVFHNLSGYDSHLFVKNLGFTAGNIDCIPNNEEKYISFTKNIEVGSYMNSEGEIKTKSHKIRFIDSFKFMAASLDSLVNNLPEDAFNSLKRYYTGDKLC